MGNDDTTSASTAPNNDLDTANLNITTNTAVGSFSPPLSFTGNEGTLAYSLASVADGTQVLKAGGGNLTSQGENVLFVNNGGVLTGYANVGAAGFTAADRVVFTLQLNVPSAGQYTFTLFDNLDHHPVATPDNVENIIGINLNNRVLVTDTGDTADDELIANFTLNVIDDVPVAVGNTNTLLIPIDDLGVENIVAEWTNINGQSTVYSSDADGDTKIDRIWWGDPTSVPPQATRLSMRRRRTSMTS